MEKRWALAKENNLLDVKTIAQQLNIDESLAQILVQRGITTFDEVRHFFRPHIMQLHDPFLMKDMEQAILRIEIAIAQQEKILIYGDYDVDGTTAVALTYSFFSALTQNIAYYIPDRHKEGYGISAQGIDFAKANNFTLIIALDCGIKAVDKIAYANSLAIDFIICDHHLPGDEIPDAIAVLDPKRTDCGYPFKELCGCGIGFKLAQAYAQKNNLPSQTYEQFLDLVMVSIGADIVPIVNENRILAYHGLVKLNTNPTMGLQALMQIAGKTNNYTITDVVFILAPRINAAGRMDHGNQAVKMLISTQTEIAEEQSLYINQQNTERKTTDESITAEALIALENTPNYLTKKTTVVYSNDWNKGVIGIVASRLTEKYYRPTIVLTKTNEFYTGSARSVAGFDLYEALLGCVDLLEQFGGHKFAAGLTLKAENISAFCKRFETVVAATITDDLLIPEIKIDAEINLAQIDGKFYRILAQMAPFGPQNMSPVFVTHGVTFVGALQIVGTKHLKMNVKQQNSAIFETIAFGLADFEQTLKLNVPFSICYTIEENVWKDKTRLQLNIKAIKVN